MKIYFTNEIDKDRFDDLLNKYWENWSIEYIEKTDIHLWEKYYEEVMIETWWHSDNLEFILQHFLYYWDTLSYSVEDKKLYLNN